MIELIFWIFVPSILTLALVGIIALAVLMYRGL